MPPAAVIGVGLAAAGAGAAISSRAQKSAQQLAREQQDTAIAEQRRLEEKFGLTPGELERQDRLFELEQQRQAELERRTGLTGEQLIREEGPITSGLLDLIQSRLGLSGEELFLRDTGDIGRQLVGSVSDFDRDLFDKELGLVLDQIQADANRRGVLGAERLEGNIGFESLGRAGVDLAIKSARERLAQQQALSQAFFNLSQGSRAEAGRVGETAIGSSDRARAELQKFLNDIQSLDAASKGRVLQATLGAGSIAADRQAQIFAAQQDIFGSQAGLGENLLSAGIGGIASQFPRSPLDVNVNVPETKQIEEFQKEGALPFSGLSGFVGRDILFDEFDRIRRRK